MQNIDTLTKKPKPVVLLILDGWGLSPSWGGNAISMGNPINFNKLWRDYPHQVLQAFGKIIDPETGIIGSSEIGHASIGAGKIVLQDLTEINGAIKDGSFFTNPTLNSAYDNVKTNDSNLHLIGLVSDGGVHSHINHLFALLDLAKRKEISNVYIHFIADGYDTEPHSALRFLAQLEEKIRTLGIGKIATISGRYWAMDRSGNWDRTNRAYEAMAIGKGNKSISAREAINEYYKNGIDDAHFLPTVITEENYPIAELGAKDSVIMFNFRADRMRQLSRAYADKNSLKNVFFMRKYKFYPEVFVASMTSYHLDDLPIHVIFPSAQITSCLAKVISDHGLNQLHIGESDRYAHLTYFFNCGQEKAYPHEDRIFVNSLNNPYPDREPQGKITEITQRLVGAIKSGKYDFIVCNIANVDAMGHTGNIMATQKATQIVDEHLGPIVETTLAKGGALIITADHGNAEQMAAVAQSVAEKSHNINPVPFILVATDNKKNLIASALTPTHGILPEIIGSNNSLADIAPTILDLMGISKPVEMVGESLKEKLK